MPNTTGLPNLPEGWSYSSIDQLVSGDAPVCYGILQPGPVLNEGVPYVRPTEIVNDTIVLQQIRKTSIEIAAKYPRSVLKTGDILLSIVGTIGKVALVPKELEGGNITQSSARIRVNDSFISRDYLQLMLKSPIAKGLYDSVRLGTAVPRLNIHHVKELIIPIPPRAEQSRIYELACKRLAWCSATTDDISSIITAYEILWQSLLYSAFNPSTLKEVTI